MTIKMSRWVVITDAAPLIALALRRGLFGRACVTAMVRDELLPKNSGQEKGPEIIRAFFC